MKAPSILLIINVSFVLGINKSRCDAFVAEPSLRSHHASIWCRRAGVGTTSPDDTSRDDAAARSTSRATYQTLFTMSEGERLRFQYDFDELVLTTDTSSSAVRVASTSTLTPTPTHAVMLIHPIGVGIGRWYYDRLMESLENDVSGPNTNVTERTVFLSPDLLGSGSASAPIAADGTDMLELPLLTVSDWSDQLQDLMADYEVRSERKGHPIGQWTVVANGGCSPIALDVARSSVDCTAPFTSEVTNVVLSSPPRLPFFLDSVDSGKVMKSYRTLSGIAGRLFWWYALRKDGNFIQRFSEKNLVGHPESLGGEWTKNCVAVAKLNDGKSRYSTFSFLAGSLQEGCKRSLDVLKSSHVKIKFIRGTDKRRNRARSWFWQRRKRRKKLKEKGKSEVKEENKDAAEMTIEQYVKENGNGGNVEFIGGRISLAHEDPRGYAEALHLLL